MAARAIAGWYLERGRRFRITDPCTGSITAVQRFGSDLAPNVHFRSLYVSGVYDALGAFTPIAAPTRAELETLCSTIAERVGKLVERRAIDSNEHDERALCVALSRSAQRHGTHKHSPEEWIRPQGHHRGAQRGPRALGASVRYLLRPPLADRRLRFWPADQVALELKSPWKDGTRWISMTADTFLERLCSLVPRPRTNQVLYRGVLAAQSARRPHVVPAPDEDERHRPRNAMFSELMKHGLAIDVLAPAATACATWPPSSTARPRPPAPRQGLAPPARAHPPGPRPTAT